MSKKPFLINNFYIHIKSCCLSRVSSRVVAIPTNTFKSPFRSSSSSSSSVITDGGKISNTLLSVQDGQLQPLSQVSSLHYSTICYFFIFWDLLYCNLRSLWHLAGWCLLRWLGVELWMGFHKQRLRSITSKGQLTPVFSSLKALWSPTQPPGTFVFSPILFSFFTLVLCYVCPTLWLNFASTNHFCVLCVCLKLIASHTTLQLFDFFKGSLDLCGFGTEKFWIWMGLQLLFQCLKVEWKSFPNVPHIEHW